MCIYRSPSHLKLNQTIYTMKVHQQQFTRAFWDHHPHHNPSDHHETTSLSLSCKRLRPLAPKLPGHVDVVSSFSSSPTTTAAFDLKSFIRPDSGPRKLAPPPPPDFKKDSLQVETHPGGTRWNPTQEQIGILEAMYCRGMRTPNAQQIEQITAQLSKYGKIEGKNVFYWFQNHKARERQKQKRHSHSHSVLGLTSHSPKTTPFLSANTNTPVTLSFDSPKEETRREEQMTPSKRKYRSWTFESFIEESTRTRLDKLADHLEEKDGVKKITLELFPLHPEAR